MTKQDLDGICSPVEGQSKGVLCRIYLGLVLAYQDVKRELSEPSVNEKELVEPLAYHIMQNKPCDW